VFKLHIDIYSIILINVSINMFLYQLFEPVKRIQNETLKKEVEKILSVYAVVGGGGDLIIWPIIFTAIYPVCVLIWLLIRGKLWMVIKLLFTGETSVKTIITLTCLWGISILFALWHWFIAYIIAFIIGLITYIVFHKKNLKRDEN
jgi:hypothetical protein